MSRSENLEGLYKGEKRIQLGDLLKVSRKVTAERGLNALKCWMGRPLHKVVVDGETGMGSVMEATRGDEENFEEVAKCPPRLIPHLRQLIFNQEKTGRILFSFAKEMRDLAPGNVPRWVQAGINDLTQYVTTMGRKRSGKAPREILALNRNWRTALAQFFLFQSMLLIFYIQALVGIIEELKMRWEDCGQSPTWRDEVWNHVTFLEYLVRERWGAWDTDDINDERWERARKLDPLHPENAVYLGEYSPWRTLLLALTETSIERGGRRNRGSCAGR